MKKYSYLILALCPAAVFGQAPSVGAGGIVNHFSYAPSTAPNGSIAEGSIFDIYGANMGPQQLAQFSGFPVPTVIAGTSVEVNVSGTTTNVLLFFVSAGQIVGVLPSRTPVGVGTLTVIRNGVRSAPAPITVVARSIGILTLNQAGTGAAVMQIPDGAGGVVLNSNAQTIAPGQTGVFYGTGDGPVTFDESMGAPFENLTVTRAIIGGVEARLLFHGRTPGFTGLDQFNVEIPAGVSGCNVSVVFQSGNISSNPTTISVADGGAPCSNTNQPGGGGGGVGILRTGSVTLTRSNSAFNAGPLGNIELTSDNASAAFSRIDLSTGVPGEQVPFTQIGPCIVQVVRQANPGTPAAITFLDAGSQLTLRGPGGARALPRVQPGYGAQLGMTPIAGLPGQGPPPYLDPGMYSVEGPGGADVGAFNVSLNYPAAFVWQQANTVNQIPRGQDYLVTWTGGDPNGFVDIGGSSSMPAAGGQPANTVIFSCRVPARDLRFSVPTQVLQMLPASAIVNGVSSGALLVSFTSPTVTFSPSGLDANGGTFVLTVGISRAVAYQ